jgi:hypothetical protein
MRRAGIRERGGVHPSAAMRAGNAPFIEVADDGARTLAGEQGLERRRIRLAPETAQS